MITLIIIGITSLVSLITMNDNNFKARFMFNAYAISKHREWWRFFSHGLLHANFMHLLFNMFSLYFFGRYVEQAFQVIFSPGLGIAFYLLLYTGALVASSVFTYFKQKDNMYYNALGASGAVAAVIFAYILLEPTGKIYIYASLPIPAYLYGPLYLLYSWYMSKRGGDNIGHDAHFWGAVYGFILPILFEPSLIRRFIWLLQTGFGGDHSVYE
jgi:membrane associated rhomboid family serine protease